jgi:medium-chain acyl-[acyl-carrier-protein] hydrolase
VRPLKPPVFALPDEALMDELRALNGTPQDILANPLAMRLFLPSLRADFEMGDTYAYRRLPPLVCPIFAYAGAEDVDTPASDVQAWTHESNEHAVMRPYPGEHLFLRDGEATVLRDLTPVLNSTLCSITLSKLSEMRQPRNSSCRPAHSIASKTSLCVE